MPLAEPLIGIDSFCGLQLIRGVVAQNRSCKVYETEVEVNKFRQLLVVDRRSGGNTMDLLSEDL